MPFNIISNVLTRYKADPSDHKKAIKDLRGEQKKQAQEALKGLEAQNQKLDKSIATWGKVAAGIGGAVVAVKALKAGFTEYEQDQRLRTAAAGANIEALRKATHGLIDDEKLLTLAAAAKNTTYALSNEQLDIAARFTLSLRKQGNDLTEVFKDVTDALSKGSIRGLKKYGVNVKESSDLSERFTGMLAEMEKQNEATGNSLAQRGDELTRIGVNMTNTYREFKVAVGELAVELIPVVKAMADIVGWMLKARRELVDELSGTADGIDTSDYDFRAKAALDRGDLKETNRILAERDRAVALTKELRKRAAEARKAAADLALVHSKEWKRQREIQASIRASLAGADKGKGKGGAKATVDEMEALWKAAEKADIAIDASSKSMAELNAMLNAGSVENSTALGNLDKVREILAATPFRAGRESILGPLIEGMRELNSEAAKTPAIFADIESASSIFRSALVSGFSAVIDGSKSVKEALRDALGETLKGVAAEMFAKSLFHGASALGALAIGGPLGGLTAAQHGAAAAAYGAGAAAIGSMAHAYGKAVQGKGSGAGAGASAGASVGSRPSPQAIGGERGQQYIYIISDQARGDRYRAETFARGQRAHERLQGSVSGVVSYG